MSQEKASSKEGDSTPSADSKESKQDIDLASLSGDQLEKVLENKNLWNLPRIKELQEQAKAAKSFQEQKVKEEEESLRKQKKFEDLANKKSEEAKSLHQQLSNMRIDQALTSKLVPMQVLDLDGALKLIDRSKLKISESGEISGVDEALSSLQAQRSYLFGKQKADPLGVPSNNTEKPSGPSKFKRSQLSDRKFYLENQKEIIQAMKDGTIENDI